MIEITDKVMCCGCYACYSVCPRGAIKMMQDEKGFEYPVIDKEKCVNCGMCKKVCPILNKQKVENSPIAYACINKNDNIRKLSSSGGIFTVLANEILERKGIVFGASFDNEYNVLHGYIENKEELEKFRGSKYVQSKINETFKNVKEFLEKDRYVYFTGTPCQIEGLKKYLNKDYDKLYTQDLICHGVPSPKVWKKYVEYRKTVDKQQVESINFRNKDNGWNKFNIEFKYINSEYKEDKDKDIYMRAFLKNISLRDSCYNCAFKDKNRVSDITLADFWGIEKILPEMYDDEGTSLVVINSNKGKELFSKIKNNIIYKEINLDEAINYNKSMIESVEMNKNREKFFKNLDRMSFNKLAKKYAGNKKILQRIVAKIKRKIGT